jgi:hypothetical protein
MENHSRYDAYSSKVSSGLYCRLIIHIVEISLPQTLESGHRRSKTCTHEFTYGAFTTTMLPAALVLDFALTTIEKRLDFS